MIVHALTDRNSPKACSGQKGNRKSREKDDSLCLPNWITGFRDPAQPQPRTQHTAHYSSASNMSHRSPASHTRDKG